MHDLKNVSIDTELSFSDNVFEDDRYLRGRIKVMHHKLNPNMSYFDDSVIDEAKWSLANIFFLANIIKDENGYYDFGGHDMHVELNKVLNDGSYKTIYDEIPRGIVPESNNYEYSFDEENGKMYVYVDFLLVKDYSNYAEDIVKRYIENNKPIKVSMEIAVDDYEYIKSNDSKSGHYNILKYRYLAITALNEKYGTGMIGAKAEFNLENNEDNKLLEYIQTIEELKNLFSNKLEEGVKVSNKNEQVELIEEVSADFNEDIANDTVETTVEDIDNFEDNVDMEEVLEEESEEKEQDEISEESGCDEDKEKYSLTTKQKRDLLDNALEDELVRTEDGELISAIYYWVKDYDDEYVYVNIYTWGLEDNYDKDFRGTYVIDEENMVASVDKESFEEVIYEPVTKEEKDMLDETRSSMESEFSQLKDDFSTIVEENKKLKIDNEKFSNQVELLKSDIEVKESELDSLKDFKANIEEKIAEAEKKLHKESVDELLQEFADELEGTEEFSKLNEIKYSLDLDKLENECYIILGKVKHGKPKRQKKQAKFNNSIVAIEAITLDNTNDESNTEDDIKKYGAMAEYVKKAKDKQN